MYNNTRLSKYISKPFLFTFAVTLGLLASTGVLASTWTGPTAPAPGNNASAPLNTSLTGQAKLGGLQINTGGAPIGLTVGGSVGIGTGNPSRLLTVEKDVANGVGGSLALINNQYANNVGAGTELIFAHLISSGVPYRYAKIHSVGTDVYGSVNQLSLGITNNSDVYTDILSLFETGSVGIGTTNPYAGSRLSVETNNPATWTEIVNYNNGAPKGQYGIYAVGSTYAMYGQGPIYSNTSFTGPAFYYTSDERLKKNIQTIASSTALQRVLALNPVTFNWIDPSQPTTTQIGFIAQQVEKTEPELVTTNASTTIKAVDYAKVTPLLVGAAQAQQAEITALTDEVAAQNSEIAALKAAIDELKAGK